MLIHLDRCTASIQGFGNVGSITTRLLHDLGVKKMKLITNNPKKMVGLEGYKLSIVEQVETEIKPNEYNRCYLECKKLKMGHLLNIDTIP